jgi:hypothetical protein
LTIVAEEPAVNSDVCFIGNGYCIFQVSGRNSKLTLENISLHHRCHRVEKTEIGACVFAMHKSSIDISNCNLISDHGFSVWAVQNAKVSIRNKSVMTSYTRSGCVSFGQSEVTVIDSIIKDCYQHGLCARGRVSVRLERTEFINNGVRAIYCYQHARMTMHDCIITQTQSNEHAAIDIDSSSHLLQSPDCFNMVNCIVINNLGIGLRIRALSSSYHISDKCVIQSTEYYLPNSDGCEQQSTGYIWQYMNDDPSKISHIGWKSYSKDISDQLEKAFNEFTACEHDDANGGKYCITVKGKYVVDISKMEQVNTHSWYSRAVRRVPAVN